MKNHTGCSHKIAFALVIIFSIFCSQISFAANCTGTSVSSCSSIGATSSTCSNYYLNSGVNSVQCKWNGSYCSDGGAMCSAGGTNPISAVESEPKCTGIPAGSCSGIANVTSSTCSNYYLSSGASSIQCKWNGSYCSDGGTKCDA